MKFCLIMLFFCILTLSCSYKSNLFVQYKAGKISNKYSDKKKGFFYIKPIYRNNNKQLSLKLSQKDSVSVFLNDSLIYTAMNRDTFNASYNVFISFKVIKNDCRNILTIVLNERKEYLSVRIKKNYVFINLQYSGKGEKSSWSLIFSNNIPGG